MSITFLVIQNKEKFINILTPENLPFNLDLVNGVVPNEMFCALDLSNLREADYYFHDIMSVVTFSSMLVELQVGDFCIDVPFNTQILIGDDDTGMLEMTSIEDLLTIKEPHAYVVNPLKSLYPRYLPLSINRVFQAVRKWQMPLLPNKNLLSVPIESKPIPLCILLADENDKFPDFFLGD